MLLAYMVEEHDPWAAARAAQREDVRAVLTPRERLCPSCGAKQKGPGRKCTECGADQTAHFARWRHIRRFAIGGLALLALAAISVPDVGALRDDAAGEGRGPDRAPGCPRRPGRVADRRRRARPRGRGHDRRPHPRRPVRPVPEDRRPARGRAGPRDGGRPLRLRRIQVQGGAAELEGRQRTGLFGYPYWLVVDYDDAKLVWCKVTPRAGEGGRSLAFVPVPEPCRDPPGPG